MRKITLIAAVALSAVLGLVADSRIARADETKYNITLIGPCRLCGPLDSNCKCDTPPDQT